MTRILIVEDSATQAERLRILLEEGGYDVLVAFDAESALPKIDANIDLVISDIVMPGISGYQLCKRIKEGVHGRGLPVMLLTTLSDPMDIISGLESGADNFLTKPYQPDQLLERVRTVLESRRLRRAGGKLTLGVQVMFLGRSFTIDSDKEQIIDLLMSTFDDIVRSNRDLQRNRAELAAAKLEIEDYAQELERRVEERTRQLAEQKRHLTQAQNMAHVGNWRLDQFSRAWEWSDEMYSICGVDRDFTPNMHNLLALVHSEDRQRVHEVLAEAIESQSPFQLDCRIVQPGGAVRNCSAQGFWERDDSGSATDFVGYCQDVTESKRAHILAEEASARYRHIMECMASGMIILNDGQFWFLNTAACRIFGVTTPEELLGTSLADAIAGERKQQIVTLFSDTSHNVPVFCEEKLVRKDGVELDVEISKAVLTVDGFPAAQVIIRDITERQVLASQLHQAQKMEVVGQLTGGLAHDFNNLLTVVISNLDMLMLGKDMSADHREMAEAALAASLRGAELTRQLLAFSRKQTLERHTVDPNELVTRTVTMLKRAIAGDVELRTRPAADLWQSTIDPAQLESAITNLVVNARDAMPRGGTITIETGNVVLDEVYAAANQEVVPGEYVMVAVSDTGYGIPQSVLMRVFEPFFTTKEVGKGTGLGLSMVYGFMKQSGGHVKIYSEEGHGTVVRLYLPRSGKSSDATVPVEDADVPVADNRTILIVEDDEAVRRTVVHQLKELGYKVLEAENGRAALAILQRERVDLLFSDVTMPGGMSGPDLARQATSSDPELKVLLTSGFTECSMREGDLAEKFLLLSKPYRRQELARSVHRALRGAA